MKTPSIAAQFREDHVTGGQSAELSVRIDPNEKPTWLELTHIRGPRVLLPSRLTIPPGKTSTNQSIDVPETDTESNLVLRIKLGNQTTEVSLLVTPTLVVTATGVGNGNIALDWEGVPAATSYDVLELLPSGTSRRLLTRGNPTHTVPGLNNRYRYVAKGESSSMEQRRLFRIIANRPNGKLRSPIATGISTQFDLPFTSKNPQDVIDKARANQQAASPPGSRFSISTSVIAPDGSTYTTDANGRAIRVRTPSSSRGKPAFNDDGQYLTPFPGI